MRWVNFLHLYQPMNTGIAAIEEATKKSYYRIVRALEEHPDINFTLNISGCLLMRWDELGFSDIIRRINNLVRRGQVDLTGTAAYHPLLPLIPEEEVGRQIEDHEAILKKYFGNYKPQGFFLPEMAYSMEVAKIIKSFGYRWIVLDEIACFGKLNTIDTSKIYLDKNSGLNIIFRSRQYSNGYPPDILKNKISEDKVFVTGTDSELYGLRHIDHTAEFEKLLRAKGLITSTVSDFIDEAKNIIEVLPVASSWESTEEELQNKNPYALWNDDDNKIQQKIWNLAEIVYSAAERFKKDKNYLAARWHLVRGLASCTWWWASGKQTGPFSPVAWSPDVVEKGLNELIRTVRSLDDKKTRAVKVKAEKLYSDIRRMLWLEHWEQHWGVK